MNSKDSTKSFGFVPVRVPNLSHNTKCQGTRVEIGKPSGTFDNVHRSNKIQCKVGIYLLIFIFKPFDPLDIDGYKSLTGVLECHCRSLKEHWNDGYPSFMITQTITIHCLMKNNTHIHRNFG